MLIKSVSGAHVIVCFQDPPCVSVCVIGCYRCCECMSGLKERLDRLQHYVVWRTALKWHNFSPLFWYFKKSGFFLMFLAHIVSCLMAKLNPWFLRAQIPNLCWFISYIFYCICVCWDINHKYRCLLWAYKISTLYHTHLICGICNYNNSSCVYCMQWQSVSI